MPSQNVNKKVCKGARRGSDLNSSLSRMAISLMKLLKLSKPDVSVKKFHRNTGNFLEFLNWLLIIG